MIRYMNNSASLGHGATSASGTDGKARAGRKGVAELVTKPEKSLAGRLCRREVPKKARAPSHFNVYVILRVMKDQRRML